MDADTTKQRVVDWVNRVDHALATMTPYFKPLFQSDRFSVAEKSMLNELSVAAWRTTGSLLLLTENQRLWDAEILLRSTCEATIKFTYILSDRDKACDRLREFSDTLFWLSSVKDHTKAKEVLSVVSDPMEEYWRPLREQLLSDKELEQIKQSPEWFRRRDIERRWGFTGLLSELIGTGEQRWRAAGSLAHDFSLQSHILHADSIGVGIVLEREQREEARRNSVHMAHGARILSDALSFALLRLLETNRFLDLPRERISEPLRLITGTLDSLKSSADEWYAVEYPTEP